MVHRKLSLATPWSLLLLASLAAAQVPSQAPSPSQAGQLLNSIPAETIRQRIQQSGLTPDQIRARLAASGYPPNLLDAYLSGGAGGQAAPNATPGPQELAAIEALGFGTVALPGQRLPVDTGLMRVQDALRAESLATGNYVFGVDVFRRSTTQFLPTLAGPVPPDYKLGAGDNLVLILTGDVEFAYTLQVTREGFIFVPQVGQIYVSNLTLDQLREVLYARLGRVYSGVKRGADATTRFDVSVASVRVNQVYVVGEAKQPGAYQISALGTVLTALYAAGGITNRANLRHIEVRRLDKVVAVCDLYDYLLRGDKRSDVRLETGDVIFVPLHGKRVQVTGAVVRPAIYEVRGDETLVDVARAAGGFRADAQLRRLAIYRVLPAPERGPGPFPRAVLDVPLVTVARGAPDPPGEEPRDDVMNGVRLPSVGLEDGDSVVVDSVPSLDNTMFVAISGMVTKPGRYPWRPGITLRDLVLLARGPRVGAYLKEAEVARLPEDRSQGQLARTVRVPLDSSYLFERDSAGHYFGPVGLQVSGSGSSEVPLEPYDNVLILRQPDFELQRVVHLMGQVQFPGHYALTSKGERLADLIGRAGGLTPQAYSEGVRFFRSLNDVGRLNIDLKHALADPGSQANVVLQPGDSIYVPEYEPSVKVTGAVNSPGSVLWQKGQDLDYYLSAAGGVSYKADEGKVSVKFANGKVQTKRSWLFVTKTPTPGPGSEVIVPVKDTTQHTDYVALFGAIAQILASTTAIIVIATQL
jgi:protein involved in polysaccharide export with SLBB domain